MQKFERIDEAIRKCRFGVNARSKNIISRTHVLHSIFESCTRRSQSAFLQGSCWHGQRRRSRGCQVARDGDAPWIEAQGSHLLELLRKNTHSAGPSGNHRISSRTASPRWWALLVRTIRSFRSGFAAVSQNFCRQHFLAALATRPSIMLAPWTKHGLQKTRPLILPNPTLTPRPLQLCPLHSEVSLVQRCGQHCPLHVINHQFSVSASLQPTRQTSCCLWDATNCREP